MDNFDPLVKLVNYAQPISCEALEIPRIKSLVPTVDFPELEISMTLI